MKKLFLSLLLIFGAFSASFAANNATDIYLLAKTKSTSELNKVENIDTVDADGNTALCTAIKDKNVDAYNLLKKAGANTGHQCVKKIPPKQYQAFTQKLAAANKSWSFLGLGKWAWTAIGVGVAAGAGIAAMSGGGGGSSSGDGDNTPASNNNGNNNISNHNCMEMGYTERDCIAENGWLFGDSCEDAYGTWWYCQAAPCPYWTTTCDEGFHETNNTCISGGITYKECELTTLECGANAIQQGTQCICNIGYQNWTEGVGCSLIPLNCGANAYQNGISCQCDSGYQSWISGIGCSLTPIDCGANATQQGTQCICNSGYENWIEETGCSPTPIDCGANATQQGTQCICNSGYENWIEEIGCSAIPIECGVNATQQETQCVCNFGYQNWISNVGCSLIPLNCGANATQQGTSCVCNSGYENWIEEIGCSPIPIDCGVNATQQETQCVCDSGYTQWTQEYGCYTVLDCGTNAYQNGAICQCNQGYENWIEGTGCSLMPIDCGANANQQETQCVCNPGYTQWTQGYGCYETLDCGANATQNGSECVCNPGYIQWTQGHGCYTEINCGEHAHQVETYCQCDSGFDSFGGIGIGCTRRTIIVEHFDESEYNIQNEGDSDFRVALTGVAHNTFLATADDDIILSIPKTLNIINNGDGDVELSFTSIAQVFRGNTTQNFSRTATGTLFLQNIGNGDIYGRGGSNSIIYLNVNSGIGGGMAQSNAFLEINNTGDGNVYGMYGKTINNANMSGSVGISGVQAWSRGTINIENHGNGNVYGMYDTETNTQSDSLIHNAYSNATAEFISNASPAYPLLVSGSIVISNEGDGDVYGMYAHNRLIGATVSNLYQRIKVDSSISITNSGSGNVYGMYSDSDVIPVGINGSSSISITNTGNGNVYGIYSNDNRADADTDISISNNGTGTVYGAFGRIVNGIGDNIFTIYNQSNAVAFGIYGYGTDNDNTLRMYNVADGDIVGTGGYDSGSGGEHMNRSGTAYRGYKFLHNLGDGWAIGIYGDTSSVAWMTIDRVGNGSFLPLSDIGGTAIGAYAESDLWVGGPVTIQNASTAYGAFAGQGANALVLSYSSQVNSNTISIENSTFAVGVYVGESGTLTNYGNISIQNASTAYGIYAAFNSNVTNSGNITITNSTNAYGIYAEEGATISNTGTISVNGASCHSTQCDGSATYGNQIVLNGALLVNSGVITAKILDLDSANGNFLAGAGARFIVENELSGDLNISSDIVQSGNQTTYIAENMIDAGDVSGLNVRSASAMFNASLADNGHDVVMQMKDFNELTDNASLAAFLKNNYTNGNGAELFSTLKSMDNMYAFNNSLSGLTGLNTFTQFAHEDLSAMREISFSMNNKLFENSSRDSFDISDSTGYFSFSNDHNGGSGRYGISSDKISDNWKLGYGMAMANINTGDGDNMHRQNNLWLFYMPATYTNDDIELVIAPKAGFAHSEYNRRGYNNINYDGYIEKRIFGLMNDLRYPLNFGNWTFAPDLAFNAIVYDQSGHEEEQAFSLVIPDDRTVSVETGLGFYTKYEKQLSDGGRFKLNSGLMLYREFGDTYDIKLGMRGMNGTFSLYNNDYEYRGAASLGFDYTAGRLHMYGNAQYFMDNDNYMNFKGGISYRF